MTSPSTTGTNVSVAATVLFNNTPVTINSQDIANLKNSGLVFSLTNPVPMGSFSNLFDWMNDNLHTGLSGADVNADIEELPSAFSDILSGFFNANVTLTTLNINTNTSTYAVGATITPQSPIHILGDLLELQQIGLLVSSASSSSP
ncbi:hypothetical protein [Azospirillum sp. B2RO_4]|uniref:hypothetical protein n=1 Tax=Azospirillum sp. B2RO_4 TaxID=3027796 RepID=UPI003DA7EABD